MLTARGWWFLVIAALILAVGALGQPANVPLALIGLTLSLWFGGQWLSFGIRARLVTRGLRLERQLRDERGPVTTLWSGRLFTVEVVLRCPSRIGLPYVAARERVPFSATLEDGETWVEGALGPATPFRFVYQLRYPAAGIVRFEGINLEMADLQGFFRWACFVSVPQIYRVLPPLVDARGRTATAKRHNLLPPPGVHRLRRPGSGSELLDIREYLAGDPPKMIAWGVSARRDRLMSKEFESEVPVRCTLFVDVSNSVRLGPRGRNPLSQLVEVAATIAQAAAGSRDLTGLCLFDDENATSLRPARGARHLTELLSLLTDAAGLSPTAAKADERWLLPLAYAFAQEVYPHLLRFSVNRFPFWLAWLSPPPAYVFHHPTGSQRGYRWLPLLVAVYLLMGLPVLAVAAGWLFVLTQTWLVGLGPLILVAFGIGLLGLFAAFLMLPQRLLFPAQRRRYRWRKQLAGVLAVLYDLGPGGLAALLEDTRRLSYYTQRFLADHQVPYTVPLYDRRGCYLFASPAKVCVLAESLIRAVGRGHDNELFVLLSDLLELDDQGGLLRAVELALARHHRVLIVCPWPGDIAPPRAGAEPAPGDLHMSDGEADDSPLPLEPALRAATTGRLHRAFQRTRRRFARIGVPVVWARGGEATRLILDRLEQLRSIGGKR